MNLKPQLNELGITPKQSSHWQLEAKISIEQLDAYCRHLETEGSELSSKGLCRFIRSTLRPQQQTPRRRRKPASRTVTPSHRGRFPAAEVDDRFSVVQGHVQTMLRIFLDICERQPTTLKRIEKREVPRYLRESLGQLDQLKQWVMQLGIEYNATVERSMADKLHSA
jgi:hypothetical protein